jgi:outer membrane biogenesis lipoprotein LolB
VERITITQDVTSVSVRFKFQAGSNNPRSACTTFLGNTKLQLCVRASREDKHTNVRTLDDETSWEGQTMKKFEIDH